MGKKVLIVGAGGIGSWLSFFIHKLKEHDQFPNVHFYIADDDTIDVKNLSYQNFEEYELLEKKVVALEAKYGIVGLDKRITNLSQLSTYDLVVSAVDNTAFRKLIFENIPNNSFYWIDLRSEGNNVSAYTKGADKQMLLDSISIDAEDKSCQRQWELEQNIIQNGNKIIASIGSQYILNWHRGEMNKKEFVTIF